jgi:hypothetical protein
MMLEALLVLEAEGRVPSADEAMESLQYAQYILDPEEDYEIEYWLFFTSGNTVVAAQFNIGCPRQDVGLDLEYEGSAVVG